MAKRTKSLTRKEFDAAARRSSLGEKTREMAQRILVGKETLAAVAADHGISAQAVSHHANTIWKLHVDNLDLLPGTVRITAVLPEDKAAIVRQWEQDERIRRLQLP